MKMPYFISTQAEYDLAVSRGHQPLLDCNHFMMDIFLRVEIQRATFGDRSDIPAANAKFYRWCWEHMPHRCEETMRPLDEYAAVHISHILSRGSAPEMAHDPRNVNILTFEMHQKWESAKNYEMRIFKKNQKRIELLKADYNQLNQQEPDDQWWERANTAYTMGPDGFCDGFTKY